MGEKSNYARMQQTASKVYNAKRLQFRKNVKRDSNLPQSASLVVYEKMVDELILEVVANCHRDLKTGFNETLFATEDPHEANIAVKKLRMEEEEKKTDDIKCPNCTKLISALRFAPHLEKCMDPGKITRSSSRIASRRNANIYKDTSYAVSSTDDDDEFTLFSEKSNKSKPKKRDKSKKQKHLKILDEEKFLSPNCLKSGDMAKWFSKFSSEDDVSSTGRSLSSLSLLADDEDDDLLVPDMSLDVDAP